MNEGLTERRRIVLSNSGVRTDLALPLDESFADVLRAGGFASTAAPSILGPHGYEVDGATLAEDLVEGGLYTIVDLDPVLDPASTAPVAAEESRADHGVRWVLLAVVALLLVACAGISTELDPWLRLAAAAVALIGALSTAMAWAGRAREDFALRGVVAPAALSFATGVLLVPVTLEGAPHLSVATGFFAAAIGTTLIALMTRVRSIRAAASTVAILLVGFGAVWAVTLLLRWGAAEAATICLGLIPLMLRALPSALVNLPDGAFIDYKHFMSHRWTVRGAIPESPGFVDASGIRATVADSWSRLGAGTIVLALVASLSAPVALLRDWSDDPFVVSGGIALQVCLVLSLLLVPRHTGARLLRWAPRAAVVVMLVVVVLSVPAGLGPWASTGGGSAPAPMLLVAVGMFAIAVVAVAVIQPVSRGARSLAWSRAGDVFEALAVALAMPAALLHADVLTLLRGMMAA